MANIHIRRAIPEEFQTLTSIALRSKAYWGYSEAFMKECELLLHVPSNRIKHDLVYVITIDDGIAGFYSLLQKENQGWLEDFFLDPAYIGEGLGKRMWYSMVRVARNHSIYKIEWESDPYAASFYERMGAVKIGNTATGANHRMLPKYEYYVQD